MIAAWMLYTIAVALLLFIAASTAEYVGRALRVPTRFVWLLAMLAAMGLSARALFNARQTPQPPTTTVAATVRQSSLGVDPSNVDGRVSHSAAAPTPGDRLTPLLVTVRSTANRIAGLAQKIDVTLLDGWNRPLIAGWIVSSLVAWLWLAGALLRLRRIERSLTRVSIDDRQILVSDNVGPALLGIVRPRIVLPRWVLGLPEVKRSVILAHEQEHATAGDPALMFAAAVLVAIQPWNLLLWPLFARLRLALESDCDRRVLAKTGDAHDYGRLLIAIHERMTSGLSPLVAFAEHQSHLERRIRRIAGRPRLGSPATATSTLAAALLVTVACTAAAPARRATASVVPSVSVGAPIQVGTALPAPALGRCSVLAGAVRNELNDWIHSPASDAPNSSPVLARFPGGCSIQGEIMVRTLDSTRVIVSARDIADSAIRVTDVLVFDVTRGTAPTAAGWYATAGHATLTDSVYYYAAPGHRTLAFRLYPGAAIRERDAQVVDVENVTALHSRLLGWDVVPELPTASRCIPRNDAGDPGSRACLLVDGTRRVEFPVR